MPTFNAIEESITEWINDKSNIVALHLRQKLAPVEDGGHAIIYPPTYADIGYNIDTLADGTKVTTVDSVGSGANRIEPIFKERPYSDFVPQIKIKVGKKKSDNDQSPVSVSLLDFAHRSADAVVMSSPGLNQKVADAFVALHYSNDAELLCALAPTSLLFGVWDSRGNTGEKRPRIVKSVIRAWDVEPLYAAAQYNSIWKTLDDTQKSELEKEAKAKKVRLSEKGFVDAPSVFRKVSQSAARSMTEYKNGSPNLERRVLGGVMVNGEILRDVTINLSALRKLSGSDEEVTDQIRRYLLSLALLAATHDVDLYLREGCHLRYANEDKWYSVPRRGDRAEIDLASEETRKTLFAFTEEAVKPFKAKWPERLEYEFDIKEAKTLLAKNDVETEGEV